MLRMFGVNLFHMNPWWAHLSLLGPHRSGEARSLLLQFGTVCREQDRVQKGEGCVQSGRDLCAEERGPCAEGRGHMQRSGGICRGERAVCRGGKGLCAKGLNQFTSPVWVLGAGPDAPALCQAGRSNI